MAQKEFETDGVRFFHDSPALNVGEAREKFADWRYGRTVHSEVVAVGHIALTRDEKRVFGSSQMYGTNYTILNNGHPLAKRFERVTRAFAAIVGYDASVERSGGGYGYDMQRRIFGGYYRDIDRTVPDESGSPIDLIPWHSDDPLMPTVRYTVCHGIGATRGATGDFSRRDILREGLNRGDVLPGIVLPEGRLQPANFEAGVVLRFTVDAHSSDFGVGGRLLHQTTFVLPKP